MCIICLIYFGFIALSLIFRSTLPQSQPNKARLKCPLVCPYVRTCIRTCVRTSVRPQKGFFDFSEIWRVGIGQ